MRASKPLSSVDVLYQAGAMVLAMRLNELAKLANENHRTANRAMNRLGPEIVKRAFLEKAGE